MALLPAAFRAYVADTSKRLSAPPELIALPLMTTAGASLGRGLAIRPKARDSWTELPNLWGAIVAPPSSMKTPCMDAATRLLRGLESERRAAYERELEAYKKELAGYELNLKAAKGVAEKTARAGGDARECPMPEPPEEPTERRLTIHGCTPEKLLSIHGDNPRGLLVLRDELVGWLRGMDKPGREAERGIYLQGWAGKIGDRNDTLSRGSDILKASCLSVFGGIQPGPFTAYMDAPDEVAKADGFLQRFSLLTWPEPVPYALVDTEPDRDAEARAEKVMRRLATLNEQALEVGNAPERVGDPPYLRFAPDAQEAFLAWLVGFMNRIPQVTPEPFQSHLSKYRKALPALALIAEVVDNPAAAAVSLDSWQRAEAWGTYLESHLRKVYGSAIRADVAAAAEILDRLKAGDLEGRFTVRDLKRKKWAGLTDAETVEEGVALLEKLGWLRRERVETGGRPSEWCEAHPQATG